MVSISRLLCGTVTTGDVLRYGRWTQGAPGHLLHFSEEKRPVVVWNITRKCNLFCVQCYADSYNRDYQGELTTADAKRVIDDLVEFHCPVVLFSGGEPLTRPDLFELAAHARSAGLRVVLSTNGVLLTAEIAQRIRDIGFSYVGVSIDGIGSVHDKNRGKNGSFDEAITGIRNCQACGIQVGLRFTLHRLNMRDLPGIFDLVEKEGIPRLCIYHLAYSGRGEKIQRLDLTATETRQHVEYIFGRTRDFYCRGIEKDILTVDNSADGVFLYLKVQEEQPERADEVRQLLTWNGGNQSGIAIGCIDNVGDVHPDQFSWNHTLGNVRERRFSEIWQDRSHPVMNILKDRKPHLKGRCGKCRYLDLCNGNLRARAERCSGDFLAPDPACYLTDEEIGVEGCG